MNHGGNLGADVYHSGTVAAVREAALHGKPGIAVSHYRKRGHEFDWERRRRWMCAVLANLLAEPLKPGRLECQPAVAGTARAGAARCPLSAGNRAVAVELPSRR